VWREHLLASGALTFFDRALIVVLPEPFDDDGDVALELREASALRLEVETFCASSRSRDWARRWMISSSSERSFALAASASLSRPVRGQQNSDVDEACGAGARHARRGTSDSRCRHEFIGSSTDAACCPHKSASHKHNGQDEERRFQSRQCPIATHGAPQLLDQPPRTMAPNR
jgi:hypothetical protein